MPSLTNLLSYTPFYSKPCNPWFFGEDISFYSLDDWFGWRFSVQLFRVVLVVHVVSHTYKLTVVVAACEKDHRDPKDLGCRNTP